MCSPEAVAGIDDRCYRPLVEFFLAGSETRIAALRRRACGSPLPGMVSWRRFVGSATGLSLRSPRAWP